jgi:alkylation response protein AidB-like acyl-CoA dehydrogenase
MAEYSAPIQDMLFVLNELAGLEQIAQIPAFSEVSGDLVREILEQNGKFSSEVLSPLNQSGDAEGSHWADGEVRTPRGFREAYRQYTEAGWNALQFPPEFGGQGLPKVVAAPVMEMWKSANLSFSLCPLLTTGAIEALLLRGTDEQKALYLPKMVEGRWTGTMNLTEPQAGSDLGLLKSRAVREGDHYRVFGQKIFITYGEHDMAENIIHLVLARTEDAPPGVRGISLFIVPKFIVNRDGSLGPRNDVRCVSIEHKLGIHASPTAVMQYGEKDGAVGYVVGEENRGLEYMFIMMNAARFAVGMEGIAIAERAYQRALAYARERIQSRDVAGGAQSVPIIRHPDVRRMLMSMKSQLEAMRALAYVVAAATDVAHAHPDAAERARSQALVDLLIPVVKGWSTECGIEIASTGVQVHGGMGYIEETGAAQHLRDARITTIYEGTTGIQANDLIGRKLSRDGGRGVLQLIEQMRSIDRELAREDSAFASIRAGLRNAAAALDETVRWLAQTSGTDVHAAYAGAVPFLKMMGIVCGGWQMARAAIAAQRRLDDGGGAESSFYAAKIATARFYAEHILPQALGLREAITRGGHSVMALSEDQF